MSSLRESVVHVRPSRFHPRSLSFGRDRIVGKKKGCVWPILPYGTGIPWKCAWGGPPTKLWIGAMRGFTSAHDYPSRLEPSIHAHAYTHNTRTRSLGRSVLGGPSGELSSTCLSRAIFPSPRVCQQRYHARFAEIICSHRGYREFATRDRCTEDSYVYERQNWRKKIWTA